MSLHKYSILCVTIVLTSAPSNLVATAFKPIWVSGGEEHSMVLTEDGRVFTAGTNTSGQLGHNEDQTILNPVLKGEMTSDVYLEDIADISAGWLHSLVLTEDKRVMAFGDNMFGQLGNGTTSYMTPNPPVWVHAGEQNHSNPDANLCNIVQVAAGRSGTHSLALDANECVFAWGNNSKGQVGAGPLEYPEYYTRPQIVLAGQMGGDFLRGIIAVSGGEEHSMALTADHFVYTWGDNVDLNNDKGKLGIGDLEHDYLPVPQKVKGVGGSGDLPNIVAISAGWDHCMALEEYFPIEENKYGRVYCWGNGGGGKYGCVGGRLGDGNSVDSAVPVCVLRGEMDTTSGYLERIVAISAGESHCLALDIEGKVWAWGDNQFGQLGTGDTVSHNKPVKVHGKDGVGRLSNIIAISAGYWHNLAIDSDGIVWVWGRNYYGQLGLGGGGDRLTPQPLAVFPPDVWNKTWNRHYEQIQAAIDDANEGDVLVVTQGFYQEHPDLGSKKLILRGSDPNDPVVVATTIIHAPDNYAALSLTDNRSSGGLRSTISGITLQSGNYGIYCDNADPLISKCLIRWCSDSGTYSTDSDPQLEDCTIAGNSGKGIRAEGSSHLLVHGTNISRNRSEGIYSTSGTQIQVSRCLIEDNGGDGIWIYGHTSIQSSLIRNSAGHGVHASMPSSLTIINNWIVENGEGIDDYYGIYLLMPSAQTTIRNNTVSGNKTTGVYSFSGTAPDITNCILWNNGSTGNENLAGTFGNVTYCCINGGHAGVGNTASDPCFIDAGSGNYHIPSTSACVDGGTGDYSSETDIDGEPRMFDGDVTSGPQVDIGGDEFYQSPGDFDADGLVNFVDYAYLAYAWQTTDANLNLTGTTLIDEEDLAVLAAEWLWQSCVDTIPLEEPEQMGMMGEEMMTVLPLGMEQTESYPQYTPPDPNTITEVLDWLDEMWFAGQLPEDLAEETYLDFRGVLEDWLE